MTTAITPAVIKRYAAYVIGAALVLLLGMAIIRAYDLGGEYRLLWSEYRTAQRAQEKQAASFTAEIAGLRTRIGDMDKVLTAKVDDIARKQKALTELDGQVTDLEGQLAKAKTDGERVIILTAEVKVWKDKFSLAEGIISDQRDQIIAWTEKYNLAVGVADRWEQLYVSERGLRLTLESVHSSLKSSYRKCRFWGTIKSGAVLAAAGVVGYSLAKGK